MKFPLNPKGTRPALLLATRVLLAALFLSSGAAKIADPAGFARALYGYELLPVTAVNVAAATVPWLEIVCGVLILTGLMLPEGLTVAALMLGVFTAFIAVSMARGLHNDCGCQALFMAEKVGPRKIVENAFFIALCLTALLSLRSVNRPDPAHRGERLRGRASRQG